MQSALPGDAQEIRIEKKRFHAATCSQCGAKMYPTSLLKPHLTRHRRSRLWFNYELKELQQRMDHMGDIV